MKKLTGLLLALILLLGIAASAEVTSIPRLGLELDIPNSEESCCMAAEIDLGYVHGVRIAFYNVEAIMPLSSELQNAVMENDEAKMLELQQQLTEAAALHTATYYNIIGMDSANVDAIIEKYDLADRGMTEIGSNSTCTYYLLPGLPNDAMPEEDKVLMEAARAEADAIAASVKIIEIEEPVTVSAFPAFETVDMNGDTVTEDIFARADLTILNVWGTFCSPCISEMPALAAWANELPESVQIVGLISDVRSTADKTYAKAEKILSKSGADFTNILNNDSLAPFLQSVTGTPTTFFIDSEGNSVHEPIVGAYMDQYKAAVEEILNN